ncbi:MAG: peroxiredoxin, partial [Gammaproteobacteria bacterium]|nr:peroxiredoxin [Gammaproteobacteria bacterium]
MNQRIKVLLTLPIFLLAFSFMDQSKANEEINIGQMAPNFNLQDQNGKWHTLNDYKGQWVVLFFYPKDGTPGCTTEACSFRDNIFEFKGLDTQLLGVSLDDVRSHKEFSEKYSLPYPILADVTKECA